MYKSFSLEIPASSKNWFNNLPALPTNGFPVSSSVSPGASPISTILAVSGLPSEKTTFLRVFAKMQSVQFSHFA